MALNRKIQTYTAYKDSYIAIEFKKLRKELVQLSKNEPDKRAASLLTNLEEVLALYNWLLGRFDKGSVPGIPGMALITGKLLANRSSIMTLVNTIEDFFSKNDSNTPEAIGSPIGQVFYLFSMRILGIIEQAPKTFDELFPFLNVEAAIDKIASYAGTEDTETTNTPTTTKATKEKKRAKATDEELLKIFPSYFSTLDENQLKLENIKGQAPLVSRKIKNDCNLYLPVIVKLATLLPIYQIHKKIESDIITQGSKDQITKSSQSSETCGDTSSYLSMRGIEPMGLHIRVQQEFASQ